MPEKFEGGCLVRQSPSNRLHIEFTEILYISQRRMTGTRNRTRDRTL
mgnify:CR=1 FL=1